jgi:hypothetical protein
LLPLFSLNISRKEREGKGGKERKRRKRMPVGP